MILGIDDAGRGPVIGPMILAGVLLTKEQENALNKIINEKGLKCKEEEPGELYVKHPAQALMYWKDKKSTYKTFRGDWVRTGDKVFEKEKNTDIQGGGSVAH